MSYLLAIFLPPVYFAMQKKWIAAVVSGFVLFISAIMFIFLPVAWPICAILAIWDLRKKLAKQHAEMIGQEVGKAIRAQANTVK